jgi:hypothetical protein
MKVVIVKNSEGNNANVTKPYKHVEEKDDIFNKMEKIVRRKEMEKQHKCEE